MEIRFLGWLPPSLRPQVLSGDKQEPHYHYSPFSRQLTPLPSKHEPWTVDLDDPRVIEQEAWEYMCLRPPIWEMYSDTVYIHGKQSRIEEKTGVLIDEVDDATHLPPPPAHPGAGMVLSNSQPTEVKEPVADQNHTLDVRFEVSGRSGQGNQFVLPRWIVFATFALTRHLIRENRLCTAENLFLRELLASTDESSQSGISIFENDDNALKRKHLLEVFILQQMYLDAEWKERRRREEADVKEERKRRLPTNRALCKVCYEEEVACVIFPCEHAALCLRCLRKTVRRDNKCPIDRKDIHRFQVFKLA